jgi:16S rRNA (guanine1516-N2)-methyltransferase
VILLNTLIPNHRQEIAAAVLVTDEAMRQRSLTLAYRLSLPVIERESTVVGWALEYTDSGLVLRDQHNSELLPLRIDFTAKDLNPYGPNLSRRQPLARALGKKNKTVIDATAGLGQDAFLMTAMGYHVVAIERSPMLAALLFDAVERADQDPRLSKALAGRLQVVEGDARKEIPAQVPPDVVYLDPMFPPKRRKSALPKRELVLLRKLVGEDPDADQLFAVAQEHARNRVVVKRPHHAPPLVSDPDFAQSGKLVRYDVYLT